MKRDDVKSNLCMGFLTVIECPEFGLFGGYLLLNRLGRPMEFHCTAPVKPSRAQQILYGATLEPYLYGEQIGRTLVTTAKSRPAAIFTDRHPVLALREEVEMPVVFVLGDDVARENRGDARIGPGLGPSDQTSHRLDAAHAVGGRLAEFHFGRSRLAVASSSAEDRELVTARLGELADSFDFREPFERIREAIEEARRGG